MENNYYKKLAVGLFIVSGFALFTVAIFVIGSKENLFTPTFKLRSSFQTVIGLKNGSSVRFNGISVGKVDEVSIEGTDRVLVLMTLEKSVQKYIKTDSRATVSSEGLVGNKVVEITPGSQDAPGVRDNERIESIRPVEVQDILASLKLTGDNAANITKDIQEITMKVNGGQGTLGQLVNNDTLYRSVDTTFRSFAQYSGQLNTVFAKINNTVDNVTGDLKKLSEQMNRITDDIGQIVNKMNSNESVVGTILTDTAFANNVKRLVQNADMTTKNLEQGSFSFAQNMEALKHNFFFKGYFEDIGYWDKEKTERVMEENKRKLEELEQQIRMKKKQLEELNNQ